MRLILALIILPLLAMAQKGRPQRVVVCAGGGSATVATCTPSPALAALSDLSTTPRTLVSFTPTANSTGAMTLAINGLTATAVRKYVGGAAQAIAADDLRASTSYLLEYDGTYFVVKSVLGNGGSGGGSGDVVGPASAVDTTVAIYDSTTGKLIKSGTGCTIASATLTCTGGFVSGDGTTESAIILKELTANGSNDFRIYGAANQSADGCLVFSGALASGDAWRGSASTVTIDGKTCRVMETYTPSSGGSSLTWRTKTVNRAYIGGGQTEAPLVASNMANNYSGTDATGTFAALTSPEATDKVLVWNTFVPDGYTSGTLTLTITGWASSATGNLRFEASTVCPLGTTPATPGSAITFNTATGATVAGATTVTEWAISGIAMTGCAAGEEISIKLVRLRSDALDTSTADVYLSALKAAL